MRNRGHPAGEVVVPLAAVFAIGTIGWHATWTAAAGILVLVIVPLLLYLLSEARAPRGASGSFEVPGLSGRHWRRRDVARHWLLPALLPIILTPGFISTVVFFDQVHIAEVKGWVLANMAPGYSFFAVSTVASALAAGWAADRFGPHRLLPVFLIPMAIGVAIIGPAEQASAWHLALGVTGLTQGTASALWGVILPVVYGTRHFGSVRSLVTTVMVISTAIGPGITGILIDAGVNFPAHGCRTGARNSIGLH